MKKKRVFYIILIVAVISLMSWLLYYLVWFLFDPDLRMEFYKGWPFHPLEMLLDYAVCCFVTFMATIYYLRTYYRAERERDHYKLLALENQINPHFVFNNFSTLAELIEVDPKKASKYLMNLSNVYRYALSHLEHDKVSLQDELTYLRQYLQLLGERFGDTIRVNIAAEVADGQGSVPPAVLQMMVENAIKHNEHTAAHPLNIDISSDGQNITLRNNKRLVPVPESTQIGIHNIEERYRLLTRQKVRIEEDSDCYAITIPIINNVQLIIPAEESKRKNTMKILIIEDEQNNADRLVRLVNDIRPDAEIMAVLASNAEVEAFFHQADKAPDVILSDIRLGDGLSFVGLKSAPQSVPVIFTTAYDQYALQAFKYNGLDYLLKPIDAEELRKALDKVVVEHSSTTTEDIRQLLASAGSIRYRERFLIAFRDTFHVVPVSEMSHVGISDGIVHLYTTGDKSHLLNMTLDELEKQLDPERFMRVNRQYIVSAVAVEKLSAHFLGKMRVHLKGYPDTEVIVSREKVSAVKRWLDF